MQVKKIAILCAAACAAMAGQASAAVDSGHTTLVNSAAARPIFISGASAVQKGFVGIVDATFDNTKPRVHFANTTASSKDFQAVAGTLPVDAALGSWSGQNALIVYRVKGGSVWGVNPVAKGDSIQTMTVTAAGCSGSAGAGTSSNPYVCPTTLADGSDGTVPDAGVSDVAPPLFQSPINTENEPAQPALLPEQLGVLTMTPIYGLAFGVPVTNTVPSTAYLNKAKLAAIMAGNVGDWSSIDGSSDDMVICRRVPGSGTQAVYNMYFGNYPCSNNPLDSNTPADRDTSLGTTWNGTSYNVVAGTGSVQVVENSTSGDVRTCLDKAATGGSYTTKDRNGNNVTVQMNGGGHKAVGVLSMDSLSSSTTTGNWKFRSLDGAGSMTWAGGNNPVVTSGTGRFPTMASYEDGTWDMQGWISFNVPTGRTVSPLSAEKLAVLTRFVTKAQNPLTLAKITDLKNVAAGIPGGDYTSGPVTDAGVTYNTYVLKAGYLNGNQCAPYNGNY